MIGIFLITHFGLGESLVESACHVLNDRPAKLVQLGIAADDDPLDVLPTARETLRSADNGRGVLLLTDLYGATPSNVASKLLRPGYVEGVTGVSLPMLLRALTYRDREMELLVAKAVSGGRDGVLRMRSDRDAAS
jgi:PTS system ascorbate-specific IIA component